MFKIDICLMQAVFIRLQCFNSLAPGIFEWNFRWVIFKLITVMDGSLIFLWNYPQLNVTGLNTLRPRQNGRHFTEDNFKCIFLNENVWIPISVSLKFVPKCLINNNPALVQIMAWRRPGDKPLSEPMMVSLPTHIGVKRPQWVNSW